MRKIIITLTLMLAALVTANADKYFYIGGTTNKLTEISETEFNKQTQYAVDYDEANNIGYIKLSTGITLVRTVGPEMMERKLFRDGVVQEMAYNCLFTYGE